MEYILTLGIIISIYVILAQSLALVAGYARLVSLAHAGFYGIGAYSAAILTTQFNLPFLFSLPTAIMISGIIGLCVSVVALRTVEDYFVICTLGIQMVIFALLNNLTSLTNGPFGIGNIPPISILGHVCQGKGSFLALSLSISIIIFLVLRNITKSPFGRILIALSEDEIFVQSLGKNVVKAKVATFTLGSMIAAIAGVLYAHFASFVDPTSFTITESILILSIVVLGGMRSLWGVAIAAIVLTLLPEILRQIGLPNKVAANLKDIIYGIMLIALMFKYAKFSNRNKYNEGQEQDAEEDARM